MKAIATSNPGIFPIPIGWIALAAIAYFAYTKWFDKEPASDSQWDEITKGLPYTAGLRKAIDDARADLKAKGVTGPSPWWPKVEAKPASCGDCSGEYVLTFSRTIDMVTMSWVYHADQTGRVWIPAASGPQTL